MVRMESDLFDYARNHPDIAKAAPLKAWDEPCNTLWGRAWLANVRRICTPRYASELAFGEKLLRASRVQSCRVRHAHAQVTFTNREGGTALVNLAVRPLTPDQWIKIERLCDRCGDELFNSDDLPDDVVGSLFGRPDGLLPELKDLTFTCSHCDTPFCLYRAATLLAVAAEFDRKPIKLFELRGATRELMFMRASQQTQEGDEQLDEAELSSVFGIELV
jgi:uncharacterized Zn finger protein